MIKKLTTPVYLTIGIIAAIGLLLYGVKYPMHLYSPGDLANAHKDIKNCNTCHKPFQNVSSPLCLNAQCHPMDKITSPAKPTGGIHANNKDKDCMLCHTEHKGQSGRITINFEHKLLGAGMNDCISCHKADIQKAHPDKYSKDCITCHTTTNWKIKAIDHRKLAGTTCTDCHKGPVDELHRDAGNICQDCHTTNKWSPATFEHEKYFPITGDHKTSCITCHASKDFKKYTCLGCHEHNTLKIRKEHLEEGILSYGDCMRCHNSTLGGRNYGTGKVHEGMGGEEKKHGKHEKHRDRREKEDDDD